MSPSAQAMVRWLERACAPRVVALVVLALLVVVVGSVGCDAPVVVALVWEIGVSPESVDLGATGAPVVVDIEITNNTENPITITAITVVTLSGETPGAFAQTGGPVAPPNVVLDPGASNAITVSVTFTPTTTRAYRAALVIDHDGEQAQRFAVLDAQGDMPKTSALAVAPAAPVGFGTTTASGSPLVRTITLTNTGEAAMDVLDAQLVGGTDYAITSAPVWPVSLLPGGGSSADVEVTFTPGVATGAIVDTLQITHTGDSPASPTDVALSAEVVTAGQGVLEVQWPGAVPVLGGAIDLGWLSLWGGPVNVPITLVNRGDTALDVTDLALTTNLEYVIAAGPTPALPATLNAGAVDTVALVITFTPPSTAAAAGTIVDTLDITHTGTLPASPTSIALTSDVDVLPLPVQPQPPVGADTGIHSDDGTAIVTLPFAFPWLDGTAVTAVQISANGWIELDTGDGFLGYDHRELNLFDGTGRQIHWIQTLRTANVIHVYSGDFDLTAMGDVRAEATNIAGMSAFVIDWRDVPFWQTSTGNHVQCVLLQDGTIQITLVDLALGTATQSFSVGLATSETTFPGTTVAYESQPTRAAGGSTFDSASPHDILDDFGHHYIEQDLPIPLDGAKLVLVRLESGGNFDGWRLSVD